MDDEPKTLQELAREMYRPIGIEPSEADITDALRTAGEDPADKMERARFRRLVAEAAQFQKSEEFARLRPFVARAEEQLIDSGATEDDILGRAWELWQQTEDFHEQMREEYENY
ncbi:MAG: hypothetical protein JWL69_4917 [Phycisphaerales bacterium]|nr:hypothetical protein [Phycisphaerales bacterium]